MPLIPFGEYRPDVSDYQAQHSTHIANVLPRGDGYGPFKDFQPATAALPASCRGFFVTRKTDGSVTIFAGTATRLYQLSNTDFSWTDVSKAGAAYAALASSDQWQFAQFNNFVFAVQANVPPQVLDLTGASQFADLGGAPPQARYIAIVGRFVVLSGLLNNPYRVQWSGLNATTTWTPGVNQSDVQDLPDGGIVRGVAGGGFGVIMQDASVRRMAYAPGSPVIFQIERIAEDHGILAPLSLVRDGDRIFYLASEGFYTMTATGAPEPIGKERVDRTFLADVDPANFQLLIGAADPRASRVFWSYKSVSGQTGLFDNLLCYDWGLNRWTKIAMSGEYIASLSQPGVTLENLDAISASIETLPFSLDDVSSASAPELAAVDADHKLGFFRGGNLEAVLDTAEQGTDARRIFVRGFRPIIDAAIVYGSLVSRDTVQAGAAQSAETPINAIGVCPQRKSTRYARGRIRVPAGTSWSFAAGLEPDVILDGLR